MRRKEKENDINMKNIILYMNTYEKERKRE